MRPGRLGNVQMDLDNNKQSSLDLLFGADMDNEVLIKPQHEWAWTLQGSPRVSTR